MVRIAIVDDEQEMLALISKCIEEAIEDIQIDIKTFTTAEEFLNMSALERKFDILVTDIGMPDMDGMELGRRSRVKWPDMSLVFLTSYSEYAVESYSIDADQYILKCNMTERLPTVIRHLTDRQNKESNGYRFVAPLERETLEKRMLYYRDIIYISKKKGSKYVQYVSGNGIYTERITLESLKQELPDEFVMVDRSYIINLRYMIKMRENTIFLKGNHQVGVSRSHATNVKQQIHDYGRKR